MVSSLFRLSASLGPARLLIFLWVVKSTEEPGKHTEGEDIRQTCPFPPSFSWFRLVLQWSPPVQGGLVEVSAATSKRGTEDHPEDTEVGERPGALVSQGRNHSRFTNSPGRQGKKDAFCGKNGFSKNQLRRPWTFTRDPVAADEKTLSTFCGKSGDFQELAPATLDFYLRSSCGRRKNAKHFLWEKVGFPRTSSRRLGLFPGIQLRPTKKR